MQVMPVVAKPKADINVQSKRLKKLVISLLRDRLTALYAGPLVMGKTEIKEDISTAYTNGYDCFYGLDFFASLDDPCCRGLIMHEKFHVILMHLPRMKKLFERNPSLANISADFAANALIKKLEAENSAFIKLPPDALYDPKFEGWSAVDIFYHLEKNQKKHGKRGGQGQGQGDKGGQNEPAVNENGEPYAGKLLDEHGFKDFEKGGKSGNQKADTLEDILDKHPDLDKKIEESLRHGGILAGALGLDMPREITELLIPEVKWEDELAEFIVAECKGKGEFTYRRYNRQLLANDLLAPSVITESAERLVFAIDTSGSMGEKELTAAATELASACKAANPESVTVLWWDTRVHGRQDFTPEHYDDLHELLKPQGGGGTNVTCVFKYLTENNINTQALVILTDGYVDCDVKAVKDFTIPTLWLITHNHRYEVPVGQKVKLNLE